MEQKKRAVLIVSFGTTYNETRKKTLDVAVADFEKAFPGYDVFSVYTSRFVKYILKKRDDHFVYNLEEIFDYLKENDYSEVVVQSFHIMNAFESRLVAAKVEEQVENFEKITFGTALFSEHKDYDKAIDAIVPTLPARTDDTAIVMMGHGTDHPSQSAYLMFEHLMHNKGHDNVLIGTIESYPLIDDILLTLKKRQVKKVYLMPLLIVAGDHTLNDLSGDDDDSWKQILKAEGYEVEVYKHSIGELPAIREIFVEHALQARDGRTFMMSEGKKYRPAH